MIPKKSYEMLLPLAMFIRFFEDTVKNGVSPTYSHV